MWPGDRYPKDVTAAYGILENWKRHIVHPDAPANDGVSFSQNGHVEEADEIPKRENAPKRPRSHARIQCYRCSKYGHIGSEGKGKKADFIA